MHSHLILLYELSKKIKFFKGRVFLTTKELGDFLGVSQQSASRYLKNLESEGFIKREILAKGEFIEFTEKGINSLREIQKDLEIFLNSKRKNKKIFQGKLISGLGEGAYYIKEYKNKIEEKLGFEPYLGTLNIKLNHPNKEDIDRYATLEIKEFSKGDERTFGEIKILPAKFFLKNIEKGEDCFLVLPKRTHHRDEIELIHKENLRKKFNLKDGEEVKVEIEIV